LFFFDRRTSFSQGFCENFNSYSNTTLAGTPCDAVCYPNLLNNWGGLNIDGIKYTDIGSQGGLGDYFLYLDDGPCSSGGTYSYNNTDFNGNWIDIVPQDGGCFCFDLKSFFIQTGTVTGFNSLRIYDGPDVCSSTVFATFVLSAPIDVSRGWVRICTRVALAESTGDLPSNSDGQRVVNTGVPADWDTLITGVRSVSFAVDVAGGDERWGIDNICISEKCDPNVGDDDDPPTEEGSYCCEGNNLVDNGNFEFGDAGFLSAYSNSTATYPGVVWRCIKCGCLWCNHYRSFVL